jgi:Zn-dependent membrane protease YugP
VFVFALVFGPGWWVRNDMSRYSEPQDRYDGTGGELARHLLDSHDLQHVKIEETSKGDHYDPLEKVNHLTPDKLNGRSLTAVTDACFIQPAVSCVTNLALINTKFERPLTGMNQHPDL